MYRKTKKINKKRRKTHRSKKMRGGTCNAAMPYSMKGGTCSPSHAMPYSVGVPSSVGVPYNAADLNPKGNMYAYNPNVQQWPDQSNAILNGPMFNMHGGRKRSHTKSKKSKKGKKSKKYGKTKYGKTKYGKRQRGGGISEFITTLLPQEIVTIGRSLPAGVGHMYDRFNGATPSASSMVYPTNQPLVPKVAVESITPPADIVGIYNSKNNMVSGI